jgi:hypothetical protein
MSNLGDVTYRGANTDSGHYSVIARLRMQISMGRGKKKERKRLQVNARRSAIYLNTGASDG